MSASVTVVSCLYGSGYERFILPWVESLRALNTQPADVIVASDRARSVPDAYVFVSECSWRHPQAYYLQQAIMAARTDWVWILDVDDTALPDALDGLEQVEADVWQMGYERTDGEHYVVPQLTAAEYLEAEGNPFTGASAVYRDAFIDAGGFPDVAFQDFGLWRRLALIGARFESSGRTHYRYNRHERTRTKLELVPEFRAANLVEMMESEPLARH